MSWTYLSRHFRDDGMKITVENLGVLREASFEPGRLTIICGGNNTGKTYVTYALFGFLSGWQNHLDVKIVPKHIAALLSDGATRIDIAPYVERAKEILDRGCQNYSQQLSRVFASKPAHFRNSKFNVTLDADAIPAAARRPFHRKIRSDKGELFSLTKEAGQLSLVASLLASADKVELPASIIRDVVSDAINEVLFGSFFYRPFIASAERTGAAIFRRELNFARNRLLEEMSRADKDVDPMKLLFKTYQDYALPVQANVDFTRRLETVAKDDSFISKRHPGLLDDFSDIIGGLYTVGSNDTVYFRPKGARRKLLMDESSSAVRSLLDIGFYLRHVARGDDLLIVDEPELNLHPENQRRIARLFARLVNVGIRVFITTHSDYIIKELNTLIMLKQEQPRLKKIAAEEGYGVDELVAWNDIKVYIAEKASVRLKNRSRPVECHTLVPARIDAEAGIEGRSFDQTINKMNEIQDAIVWSTDE